jgi:serine/threonine protein kinase
MNGQIERFLNNADASGLLTAEEITEFIESLPADRRPQDGEQLARELVRQNKLTKYQAEQIYAGKTKLLVLGNYVVLDKLGQGGMGVVLKAEHRRLKRLVALKVMSPSVVKTPDALRRFLREVEAAAKLRHPNVVATDDANEAKGTHFLVMEYVEGSDLSVIVKKTGPLSVEQALQCVVQAARGLEYAHAQGVVHRDIKPANLLLDSNRKIKILDMGLARIEGATDGQAELTSTGAVMGTVDYMAPEQAISTRRADARSDIYSLGISLWYLLTGKCAYDGDSLMAKLLAHRDAPIPSLHKFNEAIPPAVDEVFRKMVAKQPTDRYQSMTEVVRDLEACQSGSFSSSGISMPAMPADSGLNSFLNNLASNTAKPAATFKPKGEANPITVTPAAEATVLDGNLGVSTDSLMSQNSRAAIERTKSKHAVEPESSAALPWFRNLYVLGSAGIAALVVVASLLALRPVAPGTLRTEILDSMVELSLKGSPHRFAATDSQPLSLAPGEKSFVVKRGNLEFEISNVLIMTNAETVLRAESIENYLTIKANDEIVAEKLLPADSSASTAKNMTSSSASPPGTVAAAEGGFALRIVPESYVEISTLRRESSTPMTIEMWVQAPRLRGVLFSMEGKPGVQFSCERGPDSTGYFDVLERKRDGHSAVHIPLKWPNRKRHLAMVWDTDKSVLFVDGKSVASGEVIPAEEAAEIPPGNSSVTMIGSQIYGDNRGYHCSGGTFYGLRVSSTARYQQDFVPSESFATDDKTIALYAFDEGDGQTLKDSSGNNHHGTIVGAQWVAAIESVLTKEAADVKLGDPSVVDLLSLINPAADAWLGECRKEGESLLLGNEKGSSRIQINHKVPEEYVLVAEIEKISGKDGIQFGLVIGGHPVSFVIDCFPSCITGLGLVGEKVADDNLTTSLGRRLVNGQRHTIVMHVKRDGVLASLDGTYLLEWNGDPADLALPNYEAPLNASQLWIGTSFVPVRFHSLRMKSLRDAVDSALSDESPWPYDPADGVEYVWSNPENAGPIINTSFYDEHPEVSPDGLSFWLSGGGDLWSSHRNSVQDPFGPRVNAGAQINNGGSWDSEPSLTADGLHVFFCSDRETDNKDMNLWSCSRNSVNDPWSPAVRLNSEVNSSAWDLCPAVSGDGKTLFFSSNRAGGKGQSDIWMASRSSKSDEFTNVTNLSAKINSPRSELGPFLSSDGLTLMLSSVPRGGRNQHDLFFATRSAVDAPFERAVRIGGGINTVSNEFGPCLAESGTALYFYSDRPGGLCYADIWVTRRVPKDSR